MDGIGSGGTSRVLREVAPERRALALGLVRSAGGAAPPGTWWEFSDPAADARESPDAVVVAVRSPAGVIELATFVLADHATALTANAVADQLVATLRRSDAALAHCSLGKPDGHVREALLAAGFVALGEAEDRSPELLILQL